MPRTQPAVTLRRLAAAVGPAETAGDPQLLRAFLSSRSEAAFAEIVRRHGPMVLAVCRRVLGHAQDAEDAFQAAFLVLARKAGTVRGTNLAGWLYGVAVRTARGVRVMRDRRRKHFARGQESGARGQTDGTSRDASLTPDSRLLTSELAEIVDEELAGLPEHYRLPVVLCELQGRPRKEAAAELGIPEGTLSSRLAAARKLLADRLSRRGITAPAVALSALLAGDAAARVSAELARVTARVATAPGLASAAVVTAADGVVKALFVARLKGLVVAVGLALGLTGGGVLLATGSGGTTAAADPPAGDDGRAKELVRKLGSDDFATREDAAKQLRGLGAKARPALLDGTRDPNPEIARRSAEVLGMIRADALADLVKRFDPDGSDDFDHPVWKRFKTVAGADKPARKLFAAIIADPARLRLLDAAEADPDNAGKVYAAEVYRAHAAVQKVLDLPNTGVPAPETLPWADMAAILYLGTYPSSAGKVAEGWSEGHLFIPSWHEAMQAPTAPALKRVFAAWLTHRDASDTLERGFRIAVYSGAPEVLPFARRVAADQIPRSRELTSAAYIAALAAVVQFGTPADLPLFERYFGDTSVLARFELSGTNPPGTGDGTGHAQVRDAAVGLAVLLLGGNPADLGFLMASSRWKEVGGRPEVARYEWTHFGFLNTDDASRQKAHKAARAWLAEQAKAADPEELVKQLGSPNFATREAAAKKLLDLGEPALPALKATLNDPNPEARKRAADLVARIESPDYGLVRPFDAPGAVVAVGFTPDGKTVLVGSQDYTVRMFETASGRKLHEWSVGAAGSGGEYTLAVAPEGVRAVIRYARYDLDPPKFRFGFEGHTGTITRIAFSADGRRVLTASRDGTIRLWDPDDGRELTKIEAHMGKRVADPGPTSGGIPPTEPPERFVGRGVRDAAVTPDGKRVASCGEDQTVRVFDLATGKELQRFDLGRTDAAAVAFLPDGRRVVSAGLDGTVRLWDVDTGKELRRFEGHTDQVRAVAVTPDGARLVTAGHDRTVRVWDVATGRVLRCFRGHTHWVHTVAVSPDGRTAVSGGEDKTARVWALP